MYSMHNLNNLADLVLSGLMLMGVMMIGIMALVGFIKVISLATSNSRSNNKRIKGD